MKRHYQHIGPSHPETVVRWFLDLSHHWFDESLGPNLFTGMREQAFDYLKSWIETGEFRPARNDSPNQMILETYCKLKFSEWLDSSWRMVAEEGEQSHTAVGRLAPVCFPGQR